MVFGPAGPLESDGCKTVVVEFLGGDACIDGMAAEVFGEGSGVQADAHLPGVGVPAAGTASEGVADATKERGGEAVDGADVRSGIRPEQQVATILYILLDAGGCVAGHIGEVPDVVDVAGLEVAQPEEHAVVLNVLISVDVAEIDVFTLRIICLEPEPCAGLVVITVGNEFLRCCIF